jgi:hypothetical protein
MNPKTILLGLSFVDVVDSRRQRYYVYEDRKRYVIMSVNTIKQNSFNYSVITKEIVEQTREFFSGQNVTSTDVLQKLKRKKVDIEQFGALNVLYALCSIGSARIDHRFKGKAIHFMIR